MVHRHLGRLDVGLHADRGTVLRGNVIHGISAHSYGAHGLYHDEGSSYILDEDNLVYDTGIGLLAVHSVCADPLFVDPARRDFRLKPDSPAIKLGFRPFVRALE